MVSISGPETCILGLEAIPAVRHQDYEEKLKDHIKRLRSLPFYEGSILVLDVEGNGSMQWSHIVSVVQESCTNVVVLSDYKRKTATNTTNSAKMDMMRLTRMIMDEGSLGFHRELVTSSLNPKALMEELKAQMLRYERVVIPSKNPRVSNVVVLSGKGSAKKRKDDLCLTLQRAIRSRKVFLENPHYERYRL
jgi:hypothetical protein